MSHKTIATARCQTFLESAALTLYEAWKNSPDPAVTARIEEAMKSLVEAETIMEQDEDATNQKTESQNTPSIWTLTVKDAKGTVPAITEEHVRGHMKEYKNAPKTEQKDYLDSWFDWKHNW